ncbi:RING/U-box superfamily protein, partial [Striga asiatica]
IPYGYPCSFSLNAASRILLLQGPPISDPTHFTVRLKLFGFCRYTVLDPPNPSRPDINYPLPCLQHHIPVTHLLRPDTARRAIRALLQAHWPCISRGGCKFLADKFLAGAREAVSHVGPAEARAHSGLEVEFNVAADYYRCSAHDYDDVYDDLYDDVIDRSMEGVRMVPTDKTCIRDVMVVGKRAWDHGSTGGSCVICMDEFEKGCEVVGMPCGHDFHEGCVDKWLRTSHYCPVCRYELPTSYPFIRKKKKKSNKNLRQWLIIPPITPALSPSTPPAGSSSSKALRSPTRPTSLSASYSPASSATPSSTRPALPESRPDINYPLPWLQHHIPLTGLLRPGPSRRAIRALLQARWPCLPHVGCKFLANTLLAGAREAVSHVGPTEARAHGGLEVEFHVDAEYYRCAAHDYDDVYDDLYDDVIDQSMEGVRTVPTDETCIRDAMVVGKRAWDDGSIGGSCVICMDEFEKGCDVVGMPCGHDFHEDCVDKWLRTSHYCPVCRYELPTS